MKKVVSFCLYGSNSKYCLGAIENVEIINNKYPDWNVYIYYNSVPKGIITQLEKLGCKVIYYSTPQYAWIGMFYRFLPFEDDSVDYWISRDCDSRISEREMSFVNEWIQSGKMFHIIRDHPCHGNPVLGGTFGVNNKKFNMKSKIKVQQHIDNYLALYNKQSNKYDFNVHDLWGNYCGADQHFTSVTIWNIIKDDHMAHISNEFIRKSVDDKIVPPSSDYVGRITAANDNTILTYGKLLSTPKNNIPVVIIHRTYQEYLKINLEITGKNNKIFLIGDNKVKHLSKIKNVTFVDIEKYNNIPIINECRKSFVNYSCNDSNFEWNCFERVFILKYFLEEYNIESIFHIDSDNILLFNINDYPFEKNIAYCRSKNYHQYRMSNSIHSGLLNKNFCNKFIELYQDIYINKSKFNLVKEKIKYHTDVNGKYVGGGISDMTLYYLLANQNIIEVDNLLNPKNNIVFMNNINNGEGYESKDQYSLNYNMIDITFNKNNNCLIHDKVNNKKLQIFNIHYQGGAKRFMNEQLKTNVGINTQ